MKPQKYAHGVVTDVDLDLAIALQVEIEAACGLRFVPLLHGPEIQSRPECPDCYPPKKRRGGYSHADKADKPHFVYRCFDAEGRLLYVGCTINPASRLDTHRKSSWWHSQTVSTRVIVFPNKEYALAKEREAIIEEHPRFNLKGRWQTRSLWNAQNYRDYWTALSVANGRLTHKQHVRSEARRRYGIELEVA